MIALAVSNAAISRAPIRSGGATVCTFGPTTNACEGIVDPVPLAKVLARYRSIRVTEHYLKPRTIAEYRRILDLLESGLGDTAIEDLDESDVGRWLASVPSGSASSAHSVLGACFRWADRNGFEGLARLVPGRRPRRRPRTRHLSDQEYRRLWAALGDPKVVGGTSRLVIAAIRFAMLVPLRRSELVSLIWPEVDFDHRRLDLYDCKAGDRLVPLSPIAASILDEIPRSGPYVFPGRGGRGHIHDTSLGHAFSRLALKAGINDELTPRSQRVSLHTLRHSWASKAVRDGHSSEWVRRVLGHSTVTMTRKYVHLEERDVEQLVATVESQIAGEYQLSLFGGAR